MKKILYLCPWGKVREHSWSGTHYSLMKGLSMYNEITDIDVGTSSNTLSVLIFKLMRKFTLKLHTSGALSCCFWEIVEKSRVKKEVKDSDFVVLQFGYTPRLKKAQQYMYIDLHYGYVKKMKEQFPELFMRSNYAYMSTNFIDFNEKKQRAFCENGAYVLTMGKWLAKEMVVNYGLSPDKVFAVGGGYNINPLLINDSNKKGNKILFVGIDFDRKNGPLVVEAFSLAKKIRPDIELYIAGPKDLRLEMEGIHVLGQLNHDELITYFNLCDIFCMPSKFEAYGLVFAEALTFGLPCIGRNAFEMPYFIQNGETGFLLNREDPNELKELMLKLLDSEIIRENVRKKRKWYIEEYSWNTVGKRITEIIEAN